MTDKKNPKRYKKTKKPLKTQSGAMGFISTNKVAKGRRIKGDVFETKGTGPKSTLVDKDE